MDISPYKLFFGYAFFLKRRGDSVLPRAGSGTRARTSLLSTARLGAAAFASVNPTGWLVHRSSVSYTLVDTRATDATIGSPIAVGVTSARTSADMLGASDMRGEVAVTEGAVVLAAGSTSAAATATATATATVSAFAVDTTTVGAGTTTRR